MNQNDAKRAIQAIQTLLGVEADGKIGQKTHAALDALHTLAWSEGVVQTIKLIGKMSTFGGPHDMGVQPNEGLAVYGPDGDSWKEDYASILDPQGVPLFLALQPESTTGLARRLNPKAAFIAYRYDNKLSKAIIQHQSAILQANGKEIKALVADWGPNIRTGRCVDMSDGAAQFLELDTDDIVTVIIS